MRAPSFLTSLLIGLTVFIDGVDALRILNRHVDESNNQVEEAKEDAWAWEGGGNEEPPPERVFREYNDGMYEGIAHHDDEGEGGENFMPEEGDRYHNTVVTFVNELPDQVSSSYSVVVVAGGENAFIRTQPSVLPCPTLALSSPAQKKEHRSLLGGWRGCRRAWSDHVEA